MLAREIVLARREKDGALTSGALRVVGCAYRNRGRHIAQKPAGQIPCCGAKTIT
jgi:hypothetical protein